ncbi:MAG: DUF4258 domain-containing protein [Bacteroidia bacterium]
MWYKFSKHALEELENRSISMEIAAKILDNPQQIIEEDGDKKIYQSIIVEEGIEYLIRIFVAIDKIPNVIITLNKTSKISKYWNNESKIR